MNNERVIEIPSAYGADTPKINVVKVSATVPCGECGTVKIVDVTQRQRDQANELYNWFYLNSPTTFFYELADNFSKFSKRD